MDIDKVNSKALAYVGDAVYELEIRSHLVKEGGFNVNNLQKEAVKYVSAVNQSRILDDLISKNVLEKSELIVVQRAKNHKQSSKPRYVSIIDYKKATALEALFGMLYLSGNEERINELMKKILGD